MHLLAMVFTQRNTRLSSPIIFAAAAKRPSTISSPKENRLASLSAVFVHFAHEHNYAHVYNERGARAHEHVYNTTNTACAKKQKLVT